MRLKLQARLTAAHEEVREARLGGGGESPASPEALGTRGGWKGDSRDPGDADKVPLYFTTILCIGALLYFYDIPEVREGQ